MSVLSQFLSRSCVPHIAVAALRPLVFDCYHGTDTDLDNNVATTHGWAMFFTESLDIAESYAKKRGGKVYKFRVSLENPAVLDAGGSTWDEIEYTDDIAAIVRKSGRTFDPYVVDNGDGKFNAIDMDTLATLSRAAGYDGLVVNNLQCSISSNYNEIVAFHDHQIMRMGVTASVVASTRPTTNSEGNPIHETAEGIENFWRWFGNSKTVDAQGRPVVYYHAVGRNGTFNEFRADKVGSSSGNYGHFGAGFYFTDSAEGALTFSRQWGGTGDVLACYLRIEHPFIPTTHNIQELGDKNPHLGVDPKVPVAIDMDDLVSQLSERDKTLFNFVRNGDWGGLKEYAGPEIFRDPKEYERLDAMQDIAEYETPDSFRGVPDHVSRYCALLGVTPKMIHGSRREHRMEYLTDLGASGKEWTKAMIDSGHDGVLAGDEFVVFNPNQIKSATENSGAFSPTDNIITASSGPLSVRAYHSTNNTFDSFRPGSWFSEDEDDALEYGGGRLVTVELSFNNLADFDKHDIWNKYAPSINYADLYELTYALPAILPEIVADGYDGIFVTNHVTPHYCITKSEQAHITGVFTD